MMLLVAAALAADPSAYFAGLDDPSGWQEVDRKTIEGVEVVVRYKEVLGTNCLEGTTTTTSSPDLLLRLAADIPSQPGWSSWDVPVSERLGGTSTSFDYFQVLDNPSPVADRYWVLHADTAVRGDVRTFKWQPVAPTPELQSRITASWPDAVMTVINVGDWTFKPSGGATSIRYRICTDAGGAIPRWMGEFAARTTLPTNLADIVREARKRGG